jgi:hypothetical protein
VAVDGSHLYWGIRELGLTAGVGEVGRANLDGTSPNPNFITGATHPCGVAVDAGVPVTPSPPPPATGQRARALKKCKKLHSHKARKKCKNKANKLPV